MLLYTVSYLIISLLFSQKCNGISSPIPPFITYKNSIELQTDVADLWWTTNETQQEIIFELHIKTIGWIALGISPAGGMTGADIGLGWIDEKGLHFQDRFAYTTARPVVDNTTIDWFGLQGRQQNGWTAIQFKRAFDTCDKMDVSIISGTNILLFAYGLENPDMSEPDGLIYYHENRRGTHTIPLRSYGNPPPEEKFAGLDYFDFRIHEYIVPANDTTYYCQVYRAPKNITERRHAIAHKTMLDSANIDIVHHLLMYECEPTVVFDDNNLPQGICDDIINNIIPCASNIAIAWAVGGDYIVEFPEVGGYPVGGDFEIKYYMLQMHYNNPQLVSNRRDSTGIRFYLGDKLRQYDLGYLTLGTDSSPFGLAIPPRTNQFIVDSYCPVTATNLFPKSGITVVSSFPHTHLQGRSIWTKIIRNKTAVDYLFNAQAYNFSYQYENRLPKPIQLFPGDELATRCIYSTTNKNELTVGGERTRDEMCLHIFTYYPRMNNMYLCLTLLSEQAWLNKMNSSSSTLNYTAFSDWLMNYKWTPESILEWQEFYDDASHYLYYGHAGNFSVQTLPQLPEFTDLKPPPCKPGIPNSTHMDFISNKYKSKFFFNKKK